MHTFRVRAGHQGKHLARICGQTPSAGNRIGSLAADHAAGGVPAFCRSAAVLSLGGPSASGQRQSGRGVQLSRQRLSPGLRRSLQHGQSAAIGPWFFRRKVNSRINSRSQVAQESSLSNVQAEPPGNLYENRETTRPIPKAQLGWLQRSSLGGIP